MEVCGKIFACVMLLVGAIECFAGFKIMKFTLALWGLGIGVACGTAIGIEWQSTVTAVVFSLIFGAVLALSSFKMHLFGTFIKNTFLIAFAMCSVTEDIPTALIVGTICGGAATYFSKHGVIACTAFSGARAILFFAYIVMSSEENPLVSVFLWIPITAVGIAVQYVTTKGNEKKRVTTWSERKYPGMQKAYRNFCIKCGNELRGADKCQRCGYNYED